MDKFGNIVSNTPRFLCINSPQEIVIDNVASSTPTSKPVVGVAKTDRMLLEVVQ